MLAAGEAVMGYGRSGESAREVFLDRRPSARNEALIHADHFLLVSGIEVHSLELAAEVTLLRVAVIMQRSLILPLAIAAGVGQQ